MLRTALEIAGVRIALRVHGPLDLERFRHRFGFYEKPPDAGVKIDASLTLWIDPTTMLPGPDLPAYPAMRSYVGETGVKLLRESLSMWLGDDLGAEAFARGPAKPLPMSFEEDAGPADTPLRVLATHALLRSGRGALLHSSGYADADGGVAFAGESGAGKTTVVRGLPSEGVLSDDQVAVLVDGPRVRIASTPFVGAYGRASPPREAALRAIVLLDSSRRGSLERVDATAAIPAVLACVPIYARTARDASAALAAAARIARDVKVLRGGPTAPGRPADVAVFYASVRERLHAPAPS